MLNAARVVTQEKVNLQILQELDAQGFKFYLDACYFVTDVEKVEQNIKEALQNVPVA